MENSVEGLENKLRFPRGGKSQKGKKGHTLGKWKRHGT